jgi:serine/threonine protein kinase/HEAT repeat protein
MVLPREESRQADHPAEGHTPAPDLQAAGLQITGEVGWGVWGTVYRASDGKRALAVKVLRKGVSVNRAHLDRFTRESENRICHPNLATIEHIGETRDGHVYYVMPLLRGDALEALLGELRLGSSDRPSFGPLAVGPGGELHPDFARHVAKLFSDTADGLEVAHNAGVVHGRLSPRNLIFTPAGRLVITDFGGEPTAGVADDIVYRTPEQLDPFPEQPGPAADVYALGVLLFEVLARRPLNESLSPRELKDRIRARRFPGPQALDAVKGLPREIKACIHKALAVKPAERYKSAGALRTDLKRFLRHEDPLAAGSAVRRRWSPQSVFPRLTPPRAATVCALALLLGSAWFVGKMLLEDREWAGRRISQNPGLSVDPELESHYELRAAGSSTGGRAQTQVDLLIADLVNPNPAVSHATLEKIALEIKSGTRPREDARLAARLLWSRDSSVRRHAIETLALCGHSYPLLNLLLVAEEEPTVYFDGRTFFAFHDALEQTGDEEAIRTLCHWSLEECEELDRSTRPASVPLEPNLVLELEEDCPREFTARWIRARARFDPESLLSSAARLAGREEILTDLIAGLSTIGNTEAQSALAHIACEHTFTGGREALKALATLGAHSRLLDLARGPLPVSFRKNALELLGDGFGELYLPELEALVLTSPDASIRTASFRFLSSFNQPATFPVITAALDDPRLKSAALLWLESLPADDAAPVLIELLEHPGPEIRARAVERLVSVRRADLLLPLVRNLLSPRRQIREAALTVLTHRHELPHIPKALSSIFAHAQPPQVDPRSLLEDLTVSFKTIWSRMERGFNVEVARFSERLETRGHRE